VYWLSPSWSCRAQTDGQTDPPRSHCAISPPPHAPGK
jgi:hypothetical protein